MSAVIEVEGLLVRLPLIFVSGVFVPIGQMPQWGQWLSHVSPLSYTTELLRAGIGQQVQIGPWWCVLALVAFSAAFWLVEHDPAPAQPEQAAVAVKTRTVPQP